MQLFVAAQVGTRFLTAPVNRVNQSTGGLKQHHPTRDSIMN